MAAKQRTVKHPDVRRDEIVDAARALFARQGVRATTFQQVADAVGVTRGLVYHYAGDMDGLVEQVLTTCVSDFAADLRTWDAARRPGAIDEAVSSYVVMLRRHVPHRIGDPAPDAPLLPRFDDAGLYVRYIDRSVEAVLDVLEETTIPAYAARHDIQIEPVRETFAMLIHGIVGLMRTRPELPDSTYTQLVRQTLRLAPSDPA